MVKKRTVRTSASRPTRIPTLSDDLKSAALVVSVLLNLAFFIGWLALKLTNKYDQQVLQFLFG